jgi:nitrate reductase gamma subunit
MLELFLFVALPYFAVLFAIAGSIYRYRYQKFGVSSLSSQFLESNTLRWGSMPWHIGILVVLIGHLIPIALPGLWQSLTANPVFLIAIESLGIIAAFLCLIGLGALIVRRLTSAKLQLVTSVADLAVLFILFAQVLVGIGVATGNRWGAAWSTSTTTPYLWSLISLQPKPEYITGLPPMVKFHLVLAWAIILLIPFTRLVHMFAFPLPYLWRAPQKVVWTKPRRALGMARREADYEESRRHFLRGAIASSAAAFLLAMGVADKFFNFFRGPRMNAEQEMDMLTKKLQRLELAANERTLELERLKNEYILVGPLAALSPRDGKYFTDYQMRPALAFKDDNGLPLLISAKCTHLGCTVASTMDEGGRILCPCHISYFDVKTGMPNAGSPAKAPLPMIGWALMDPTGKVIASRGPGGEIQGEVDPALLANCSVYIAKQFEETA